MNTPGYLKIQISLLSTIFFISGCASDMCTVANASFTVGKWPGDISRQATLYYYKKDSNFSILERTVDTGINMELHDGNPCIRPALVITLSKYLDKGDPTLGLSVNRDYKLVLDKIEYRISGIVPGRTTRACLLGGAKVNQCKLNSFDGFGFISSCGNPVSGNGR